MTFVYVFFFLLQQGTLLVRTCPSIVRTFDDPLVGISCARPIVSNLHKLKFRRTHSRWHPTFNFVHHDFFALSSFITREKTTGTNVKRNITTTASSPHRPPACHHLHTARHPNPSRDDLA